MKEPKADGSGSGKGAKALIYVVDDEPMLLELTAVILEPAGYALKTFRDPKAALRAFASAQPRPNLVITDFAMQGMDGLELMAGCRRLQPGQKVLLLSGTVDEEVYGNASDKPDRFLAKPYQARQLIDMVKSMLAK